LKSKVQMYPVNALVGRVFEGIICNPNSVFARTSNSRCIVRAIRTTQVCSGLGKGRVALLLSRSNSQPGRTGKESVAIARES
jgi:hypothetical protein